MTLTTYAGLQAEIVSRVRRSDLTTLIPGFIALFEAKANRLLRVRQMISRATATVDAEYTAVPTDFAGARTFSITSTSPNKQLNFLTPDQLDAIVPLAEDGTPRYFTVMGSEFRFYPAPGSAYTAALSYYATIPALSDSNTSNWLLTTHPDAYVAGTMEQANLYLKNADAAQLHAADLTQIITDIVREDAESMGVTLSPMPSTPFAGYL